MANIYEAPKSELSDGSPANFKLYKLAGIGWATFFGSIFAGGYLLSQNYKNLGQHDKAKKALSYSLIATIIFFAIVFLIPEDINIPNTAFTVPQIVAMVQFARTSQGQDLENHTASGGETYSNWRAVGIGILVGIVLVAVIAAGVVMFY